MVTAGEPTISFLPSKYISTVSSSSVWITNTVTSCHYIYQSTGGVAVPYGSKVAIRKVAIAFILQVPENHVCSVAPWTTALFVFHFRNPVLLACSLGVSTFRFTHVSHSYIAITMFRLHALPKSIHFPFFFAMDSPVGRVLS